MGEVKRYEAVHLRYDDNNIRYGDGCEVEVVLASDYATLEAENAKLRAGQESLLLNLAEQKRQAVEYRAMWAMAAERACAELERRAVPEGWKLAADALPTTGKPVMAYYLNSHGMGRRIRAMHVKRFTVEAEEFADPDTQCCEYSEQDDCYYMTEGWYELIDNWPDYASCAVIEGVITHWMPLPAAPGAAPSAPKADLVKLHADRYLWLKANWHGFEHYRKATGTVANLDREIDEQIAIAAARQEGGEV